MTESSLYRLIRSGSPMAALLAALSGCMYMNHDETRAPAMTALEGRQFTTVQDAFLIKNACIDDFKAKHCAQLQVVQGHYYVKSANAQGTGGWTQLKLPVDTQVLAAAPELAARLTWVPKGTLLKVVQIESRSMGQYRRCWVIYATSAVLPADTVAEIPACDQWAPESEPLWFHAQPVPPPMVNGKPVKVSGPIVYDYEDRPPLPDPAFLTPAP